MAYIKDFEPVSVAEFALIIGISERKTRTLIAEGKLSTLQMAPRILLDIPTAVQDYIRSMKPDLNSDDPMAIAKLEQTRADAELKKAKAAKAVLELQEFEGQMHRSEDVEAMTTDLIFTCRAGILSLPGKLAVDCANLTTANEISGRIKKECYNLLEDLSSYQYDAETYKARVRERERMALLEEEETETEAVPSRKRRKKTKPAA